jgi:hypothetical protein
MTIKMVKIVRFGALGNIEKVRMKMKLEDLIILIHQFNTRNNEWNPD